MDQWEGHSDLQGKWMQQRYQVSGEGRAVEKTLLHGDDGFGHHHASSGYPCQNLRSVSYYFPNIISKVSNLMKNLWSRGWREWIFQSVFEFLLVYDGYDDHCGLWWWIPNYPYGEIHYSDSIDLRNLVRFLDDRVPHQHHWAYCWWD